MDRLSIIVPVYNVASYIEECVLSLLKQTYKNFEIILVDDGSTDGCYELCEKFASENQQVIVIHQNNSGLPAARNAGLQIASGDIVGFVDSDDIIAPEMYSTLIQKMVDSGSDMAICNFQTFNINCNNHASSRYADEVIEYRDQNSNRFYQCAMDSSCNRVYKMSVIKNNGLTFESKNIVAQEDYWFLVRYFSHIEKVATTKDAFYKYRERASSISKGGSDSGIASRCLKFVELSENYIKEKATRDPEPFLCYQIINLLFASINTVSKCSIPEISKVVKAFAKNPYYQKAIAKKQIKRIYPGQSIRMIYNRCLFTLLRMGLVSFVSTLECLRLRRLRSASYRSMFFK